ncbi:hypothetical protein J7L60_08055, partial [Candidatus Bathyarchaeota archaeon]|nr:hypothetical protein [Candidatus Bathyarchaeota archaeon]
GPRAGGWRLLHLLIPKEGLSAHLWMGFIYYVRSLYIRISQIYLGKKPQVVLGWGSGLRRSPPVGGSRCRGDT